MENQLDILAESLEKKIVILQRLQEYSAQQEQVLDREDMDLEAFDALVEKKDKQIDQLNKLDSGFEILYRKLSKELEGNRDKYAKQIKRLQELIAQVMEMSVSIQAQEQRNKTRVEAFFAGQRAQIRQGRKSSKAAYDYYKNMSKSNYVMPQFFDGKK
ncbi:MAG: flagellar export chaperone FlgN [Lachnospiraceae bacterium]|nr:flagellar export chaperone FlgN [Lachnospiraceae bacterium]